MRLIKAAAAGLLAFLSYVQAQNSHFINECDFDVYLLFVDDKAGNPQTLSKSAPSYSEPYRTRAKGGIAVQVATKADQSVFSLFEYHYDQSASQVWYDISNILGQPFKEHGITLEPSALDVEHNCVKVNCPAGDAMCKEAYNKWNDDFATHVCSSSVDLTMRLCPKSGKPRSRRHAHRHQHK
ncbi:hypothetical protein MMC24_004692 [Lignoscripta atroalba]|nr:hypothetical protein [Lignoscripta atroalba]